MSKGISPFRKILADLRKLAKSDDPETAHKDADQLLGSALLEAADAPITRKKAVEIIEAWQAVKKWYA